MIIYLHHKHTDLSNHYLSLRAEGIQFPGLGTYSPVQKYFLMHVLLPPLFRSLFRNHQIRDGILPTFYKIAPYLRPDPLPSFYFILFFSIALTIISLSCMVCLFWDLSYASSSEIARSTILRIVLFPVFSDPEMVFCTEPAHK